MTVIVTELTEVHRILQNFKKKTFGIHRFLCKMIVTHTSEEEEQEEEWGREKEEQEQEQEQEQEV